MQLQSLQTYHVIHKFIHELLDKKYYNMRELRKVQQECRAYVEDKLSRDSNLQSLLRSYPEQSSLMKELIVNFSLMKMSHHAALWEIDFHTLEGEKLSLTKEEQSLLTNFDELCNNAYERMKSDEGLIQMALNPLLSREFESEVTRTLKSMVCESMSNPSLQSFYKSRCDVCRKVIRDWAFRFLKYAQDHQ